MKTIVLIFLIFLIFHNNHHNVECKHRYGDPFNARLANYLIDYFQLDKLETSLRDEEMDLDSDSTYKKCDSNRSIQDYFFQVYGSEENNKNFSTQALEDLIYYHLKKSRKSQNEKKHLQYRCERKTVIF